MKNNIKATKMQLAEIRSVKAPVSCLQTRKVSNELVLLSNQLKGSLRESDRRGKPTPTIR
jgi:hypothetical protein